MSVINTKLNMQTMRARLLCDDKEVADKTEDDTEFQK